MTFTVGTPRVGVPLTAELEDPDGDETGHEWQWMVAESGNGNGAATVIDGATSATFTPRDRDLGDSLSVKVKYTDGKGKDEVTNTELATAVEASAAPRFYDKAVNADDEKVVKPSSSSSSQRTRRRPSIPATTRRPGTIFVGHRTDDVETS